MQVSANKSTEKVQGYSLYTGLSNFRVISINPSLEKIRERINPNAGDDAAKYHGKDNDGVAQIRIDFHLLSTSVKGWKTKIAFFLTAKNEESQDGKPRFIDKKGNYSYSADLETLKANPKMDWMDKGSLKAALSGEPLLIDFLKAWLNVDTRKEDSVMQFDDPTKMAKKGDITELRTIFEEFKDNEVKLLAIVRTKDDKTYQDFYKRYFGVPYVKSVTNWTKALENEYSALKPHQKLENGLEFTEYVGEYNTTSGGSEGTDLPATQDGGYEDQADVTF